MSQFKPAAEKPYNFTKTLFFALCLVIACISFLYYFLGFYTDKDKQSYERLIKGDKSVAEHQTSKQLRRDLKKDLYLNYKGKPLHLIMQSDQSELLLETHGNHTEVIEKLHNVSCWVQEERYLVLADGRKALPDDQGRFLIIGSDSQHPGSWVFENDEGVSKEQVVLLLEADHAEYFYKGGLFIAENVKVYRFLMPGHTICKCDEHAKLIAEAYASKVEITLRKEVVDFKADAFFGTFQETRDSLRLNSPFSTASQISLTADHVEYRDDILYLKSKVKFDYSPQNLTIQSDKMQVTFDKDEGLDSSSKAGIRTFIAQDDVLLTYRANFHATCDYLFFKRSQDPSFQNRIFPGMITLSCYSPDQFCGVNSLQGDSIIGKKIILDTVLQTIKIEETQGVLVTEKELSNPIHFSADHLEWNESLFKLTFSKHVELSQDGVGSIQTPDTVSMLLDYKEGKKNLKAMDVLGDSLVTFFDAETQQPHRMKSSHSIKLDYSKMEVKIRSAEDSMGNVMRKSQISFVDAKGNMHADRGFIKYELRENQPYLSRIVLEGNVKMINRLEPTRVRKLGAQQYILADRVDFLPLSKEMFFKAKNGGRVLLFDESNHLEVSAPAIKLLRDSTKKETVKGIGDVRFSFNEGEINQFRSHFLLRKEAQQLLNPSNLR